jgi:uncharacterized protein (DUF1800 family)
MGRRAGADPLTPELVKSGRDLVVAELDARDAAPDSPPADIFPAEIGLRMLRHFQDAAVRRRGDDLLRQAALREQERQNTPPSADRPAMPAAPPTPLARIYRAELSYRFQRAVNAPVGYIDRLMWFWSNHFAVARAKGGPVLVTVGAMERDAIRPRVLGRFRDLLGAVTKHQAMLIYLDNDESIGPHSRAGLRRGRGLNENLARELLELHTLGINGGYTQADVTAVAAVLTGWTVSTAMDELGEMGETVFNPNRHEPGPKTVLGIEIPETGAGEIETLLDLLAAHPSTARHIARKLASHFVSDTPPAGLVDRLTDSFITSGGDLAVLARALVTDPQALSRPGKIRMPAEAAVAMMRAGVPFETGLVHDYLRVLGTELWNPPAPNGFPDRLDDLLSPVGMKNRLEAAVLWARRVPPSWAPAQVLDAVMIASDDTRQAVLRAESREQAFAILFMAPEFLWR